MEGSQQIRMEGSQQIVELGASAVCVGCVSMLSAIISRKCSRTGGESGILAGLCYACVRSIRCQKPSYLPLVTFITPGTLATQKRLINPNRADYGVDCMDSTFVVRPQTAAPSRHPATGFRSGGGGGAGLFRELDVGNLRVWFDEREQETGSSQTRLRRAMQKHPHSHREVKATAPGLDSTRNFRAGGWPNLNL